MYEKYELTYKNGYIVNKDDCIINVDDNLVRMFNDLERRLQKALYNANTKQEPAIYPGFEFISEHYDKIELKADTPKLDAKIQESIDIMDEIDNLDVSNKAKVLLDRYEPIVEFVRDDFVVPSLSPSAPKKFDLRFLGNPLKLDLQDLVSKILIIAENE